MASPLRFADPVTVTTRHIVLLLAIASQALTIAHLSLAAHVVWSMALFSLTPSVGQSALARSVRERDVRPNRWCALASEKNLPAKNRL